MKTILAVIILSGIALATGCKHEPVLPDREVSFANEILPIIQASCQHNGCHGTTNTSEFTLLDYNDVIENGDVKPGNAADSDIYKVVTGRDNEFMPLPPYPALSKRQTTLLLVWIEQGAKNN
ncbi:MAG: hypothetical protein IM638_15595 [Bacteroidetes bacterium]|nr:hypothetical protein [Bacteroidota bacterium]